MHVGSWKQLVLQAGQRIGTALVLTVALVIAFAARATIIHATEENDCKAHLRAIGVAVRAYTREHGHLPSRLGLLYPQYLKDREMLMCPHAVKVLNRPTVASLLAGSGTSYVYYYQYTKERPYVPVIQRPLGTPEGVYYTWEQAKSVRGEDIPIVTCALHDPFASETSIVRTRLHHPPRSFLVCRLNGQVEKTELRIDRQISRHLLWYEW
jgi:hypothetical protein